MTARPEERARRGRRETAGAAERAAARPMRPRTGARRTVMDYIRQLPNYVRLLVGLLSDRRVAGLDKLLVGAAIAYILLPADFLPDVVPFLGQVDDVYLLTLALQRLIANAGRRVLLAHWSGPPEDLSPASLQRVLAAAAFFLPRNLRRRLRGMAR